MALFGPKYKEEYQGGKFKIVEYEKPQKNENGTYTKAIIYDNKKEVAISSYQMVGDNYLLITSADKQRAYLIDSNEGKEIGDKYINIESVMGHPDGLEIKAVGENGTRLYVDGKLSEPFEAVVTIPYGGTTIFHGKGVLVREGDFCFYIDKTFQPVDDQRYPLFYAGSGFFTYDLRTKTVATAAIGCIDVEGNWGLTSDCKEFDFLKGRTLAGLTSALDGLAIIERFPQGIPTKYVKDLLGNVREEQHVTEDFKVRAKAIYDYAHNMCKITSVPKHLFADEKFVVAARQFAMKRAFQMVVSGGQPIFSNNELLSESEKIETRDMLKRFRDIATAGKETFVEQLEKSYNISKEQAEEIYERYSNDIDVIEKMRETDTESEL